MNDEEINRAIAEHLGWTGIRMSALWEFTEPGEDHQVLCGLNPQGNTRAVPNYCCDLNAIQSIIIQIRDGIEGDSNKRRFEWGVANELYLMNGDVPAMFRPASDWCKALLRFVGKWKENE